MAEILKIPLMAKELGVRGNRRLGGGRAGYEIETREGLPELREPRSRYRIYSEMRDNSPIVTAIMFAIITHLRRVHFFFQSASDSSADKAAADFCEGLLGDMSTSWAQVLPDILTMLTYGFVPMEIVLKKRQGRDRDPSSQYNDGLIGVRKLAYRHQETLATGGGWLLDDAGGVQGIVQEHPDTGKLIQIPIEKLLIFRTDSEIEGRSIQRGMWIPYYYARELQEIEAISAERMGAGYPVGYLGEDRTLEGADSDYEAMRRALENVRIDEQMCLVFPGPKLYTTSDGRSKGFLFELVSPPSRGLVDFESLIQRYQKEIAMTVLAQFIFLGMEKIGTQALAIRTTDIFALAMDAFADMIAEPINRYLLPRLWKVNQFPLETVQKGLWKPVIKQKVGAMPYMDRSSAGLPNLKEISEFINVLVGAQVLTPDGNLETYLREFASLPEKEEKPVEVGVQKQERLDNQFINSFTARLEEIYSDWYAGISGDLFSESDENKRAALLAVALLVLREALLRFFREELPAAIQLATGGEPLSPQAMVELADVMLQTEEYLGDVPDVATLLGLAAGGAAAAGDTFLQALGRRVMVGMRDPTLFIGGALAINALFATLWSRLASYSGQVWQLLQRGIGELARRMGVTVRWVIDPLPHEICMTCLTYGNREYESYDALLAETGGVLPAYGTLCNGNCRCYLQWRSGNQWLGL